MNLNETKRLLKEVAVIDNRKLSEEVAEAWQAILGFMEFEIATEALHLARRDASINWLEPRHLVAWGKEASHRRAREQRSTPRADYSAGPTQPRCGAHSVPIMHCRPCCKKLIDGADTEEIYA